MQSSAASLTNRNESDKSDDEIAASATLVFCGPCIHNTLGLEHERGRLT